MPKRLAFLVATCLTAGLVYSFGCGGDGGGGDKPPPPPPPQTIDKVVWGQVVPLAFELAVPVPAPESEEQKAGKAAQKSFYTEEETEQAKTVALFASNPDGSGTVRLTPKKMSAVQIGDGLAPNGDLWFATKAGIFATNVSDPKPRVIMSLQELATRFSDATEPGLYWPQKIFDNINQHTIDATRIVFFPKSDSSGDYVAIINIPITYIKASSTDQSEKTAYLVLRYDSTTGETGFVFPFMSTTGDAGEITIGSGENTAKAKIMVGYSLRKDKITYYLSLTPNKSNIGKILEIVYDPIVNKHSIFDLPWYFDSKIGAQSFVYSSPDNCAIYQEGVEVPFKVEDCKVTSTTTETELDLRKKVAACMQNAINGKMIGIMCAPARDVTDLVSSKDKLAGFLTLTSVGAPKKLMGVDAGLVRLYDYKMGSADVSCPVKAGYCEPSDDVVNINAEKKQKIKIENAVAGNSEYPMVLISGIVKDGNEFRKALYLEDPSKGEFRLIDKEDQTTCISGASATKTADGILFLYAKNAKGNCPKSQGAPQQGSGFNSYYAYDPVWPTPIAMTKFIPNYTKSVQFADFADGKKMVSYVVTYDRKYAFLRATDDMLKENTYMLDLTKIFPQKVVDVEEPKAAKTENEATTEGTTPAATQAINPFGENAKMVNPVLQSQNIHDNLRAKLGDKLVWTSDQDGFTRLYWNTVEHSAFNRFTTQDIESNESNEDDDILFAQNLPPFVMPSIAVPFDISADIATELACGKGGTYATYCGTDARFMCLNGKCVDMYSCSADAPKGACYKSSETCKEGACVAQGCDANCGDKVCGINGCGESCGTCPAGKTCNLLGQCIASGQSCTQNSDCSNGTKVCKNGTCYDCTADADCGAGKKCSTGSCVAMTACQTSATCAKWEKCTGGYCEATPSSQECQVADQCGQPAADFGCKSNMCYPKVKNLTVTATLSQKNAGQGSCFQTYSKCKICEFNFKVDWDFNSNGLETFNYYYLNNGIQKASGNIECQNSHCTISEKPPVTFYTTQANPDTWVTKSTYTVQPKPLPGASTDSLKVEKEKVFTATEIDSCVK